MTTQQKAVANKIATWGYSNEDIVAILTIGGYYSAANQQIADIMKKYDSQTLANFQTVFVAAEKEVASDNMKFYLMLAGIGLAAWWGIKNLK